MEFKPIQSTPSSPLASGSFIDNLAGACFNDEATKVNNCNDETTKVNNCNDGTTSLPKGYAEELCTVFENAIIAVGNAASSAKDFICEAATSAYRSLSFYGSKWHYIYENTKEGWWDEKVWEQKLKNDNFSFVLTLMSVDNLDITTDPSGLATLSELDDKEQQEFIEKAAQNLVKRVKELARGLPTDAKTIASIPFSRKTLDASFDRLPQTFFVKLIKEFLAQRYGTHDCYLGPDEWAIVSKLTEIVVMELKHTLQGQQKLAEDPTKQFALEIEKLEAEEVVCKAKLKGVVKAAIEAEIKKLKAEATPLQNESQKGDVPSGTTSLLNEEALSEKESIQTTSGPTKEFPKHPLRRQRSRSEGGRIVCPLQPVPENTPLSIEVQPSPLTPPYSPAISRPHSRFNTAISIEVKTPPLTPPYSPAISRPHSRSRTSSSTLSESESESLTSEEKKDPVLHRSRLAIRNFTTASTHKSGDIKSTSQELAKQPLTLEQLEKQLADLDGELLKRYAEFQLKEEKGELALGNSKQDDETTSPEGPLIDKRDGLASVHLEQNDVLSSSETILIDPNDKFCDDYGKLRDLDKKLSKLYGQVLEKNSASLQLQYELKKAQDLEVFSRFAWTKLTHATLVDYLEKKHIDEWDPAYTTTTTYNASVGVDAGYKNVMPDCLVGPELYAGVRLGGSHTQTDIVDDERYFGRIYDVWNASLSVRCKLKGATAYALSDATATHSIHGKYAEWTTPRTFSLHQFHDKGRADANVPEYAGHRFESLVDKYSKDPVFAQYLSRKNRLGFETDRWADMDTFKEIENIDELAQKMKAMQEDLQRMFSVDLTASRPKQPTPQLGSSGEEKQDTESSVTSLVDDDELLVADVGIKSTSDPTVQVKDGKKRSKKPYRCKSRDRGATTDFSGKKRDWLSKESISKQEKIPVFKIPNDKAAEQEYALQKMRLKSVFKDLAAQKIEAEKKQLNKNLAELDSDHFKNQKKSDLQEQQRQYQYEYACGVREIEYDLLNIELVIDQFFELLFLSSKEAINPKNYIVSGSEKELQKKEMGQFLPSLLSFLKRQPTLPTSEVNEKSQEKKLQEIILEYSFRVASAEEKFKINKLQHAYDFEIDKIEHHYDILLTEQYDWISETKFKIFTAEKSLAEQRAKLLTEEFSFEEQIEKSIALEENLKELRELKGRLEKERDETIPSLEEKRDVQIREEKKKLQLAVLDVEKAHNLAMVQKQNEERELKKSRIKKEYAIQRSCIENQFLIDTYKQEHEYRVAMLTRMWKARIAEAQAEESDNDPGEKFKLKYSATSQSIKGPSSEDVKEEQAKDIVLQEYGYAVKIREQEKILELEKLNAENQANLTISKLRGSLRKDEPNLKKLYRTQCARVEAQFKIDVLKLERNRDIEFKEIAGDKESIKEQAELMTLVQEEIKKQKTKLQELCEAEAELKKSCTAQDVKVFDKKHLDWMADNKPTAVPVDFSNNTIETSEALLASYRAGKLALSQSLGAEFPLFSENESALPVSAPLNIEVSVQGEYVEIGVKKLVPFCQRLGDITKPAEEKNGISRGLVRQLEHKPDSKTSIRDAIIAGWKKSLAISVAQREAAYKANEYYDSRKEKITLHKINPQTSRLEKVDGFTVGDDHFTLETCRKYIEQDFDLYTNLQDKLVRGDAGIRKGAEESLQEMRERYAAQDSAELLRNMVFFNAHLFTLAKRGPDYQLLTSEDSVQPSDTDSSEEEIIEGSSFYQQGPLLVYESEANNFVSKKMSRAALRLEENIKALERRLLQPKFKIDKPKYWRKLQLKEFVTFEVNDANLNITGKGGVDFGVAAVGLSPAVRFKYRHRAHTNPERNVSYAYVYLSGAVLGGTNNIFQSANADQTLINSLSQQFGFGLEKNPFPVVVNVSGDRTIMFRSHRLREFSSTYKELNLPEPGIGGFVHSYTRVTESLETKIGGDLSIPLDKMLQVPVIPVIGASRVASTTNCVKECFTGKSFNNFILHYMHARAVGEIDLATGNIAESSYWRKRVSTEQRPGLIELFTNVAREQFESSVEKTPLLNELKVRSHLYEHNNKIAPEAFRKFTAAKNQFLRTARHFDAFTYKEEKLAALKELKDAGKLSGDEYDSEAQVIENAYNAAKLFFEEKGTKDPFDYCLKSLEHLFYTYSPQFNDAKANSDRFNESLIAINGKRFKTWIKPDKETGSDFFNEAMAYFRRLWQLTWNDGNKANKDKYESDREENDSEDLYTPLLSEGTFI